VRKSLLFAVLAVACLGGLVGCGRVLYFFAHVGYHPAMMGPWEVRNASVVHESGREVDHEFENVRIVSPPRGPIEPEHLVTTSGALESYCLIRRDMRGMLGHGSLINPDHAAAITVSVDTVVLDIGGIRIIPLGNGGWMSLYLHNRTENDLTINTAWLDAERIDDETGDTHWERLHARRAGLTPYPVVTESGGIRAPLVQRIEGDGLAHTMTAGEQTLYRVPLGEEGEVILTISLSSDAFPGTVHARFEGTVPPFEIVRPEK